MDLKKSALLFSAIYLISQFSILIHLKPLGVHEFGVQQLAFDHATWFEIVKAWSEAGLLPHYRVHLFYDFVHPIWYAVALVLLLKLAFQQHDFPRSVFAFLAMLPLIAAVFDWLENCFQLVFIASANLSAATELLVYLSSVFSMLKWSCALGALALAVFLALWGWGRKSRVVG